MKPRLIVSFAILTVAATLAGCNGPNTAYNNSGASATPGSVNTANVPATPTSAPGSTDSAGSPSAAK